MKATLMIALGLASAAAYADDVDRTHQPAAAAETAWAPPAPVRFTTHGIDAYLVERHEVPIVELGIGWNIGDVLDPAGKEGLTSLCTDVMGEGTKELDKNALEDKKADIAASVDIGAGREAARMTVSATKERIGDALDLAAKLLMEPGMRAADFERLKSQRKANVLQQKGNADGAAARVYAPVMFGAKHPYGRIVTSVSLDAIKLTDCAGVAQQYKPEGASLVVVGDVTRAEVEKLVDEHFAKWTGKAPGKLKIGPPQQPKGTIFFVDVPGAQQSRIMVAHHGPARGAADYYATSVMAQVLGSGIPSRVVQNLREKNGYTYGANARFNYGRSASTMVVASSVRTDVTGKALREVMNEMKGMTTKPPSDEEVNRERTGTIRALPARFATDGATLGTIWEVLFFDLPLDTFQKMPAELKAVDTKAVARAVKDRLRTDNVTVVVAGDRAKIWDELQAIAKDKVFGKDGIVVVDGDAAILK